MSKLIGAGGLLVTAGIAEQDIRRLLCAAAFEELSDRCQIARAAALKMKVMNEPIFKVKGNFSCTYALRGEFEALHNDFSFQDHSHDSSLLYWRMGIRARKGSRVNIGKPVARETLIKSLSDFILGVLYRARRHSTRIASYLRRMSTTLCIKLHMKSDSVI